MRISLVNIIIINGPNLNLIGRREPKYYGKKSFDEFLVELYTTFPEVNFSYFQSNSEGSLIDTLQVYGFSNNVTIIFNPAAYTHTSIALRDCIAAIETPVIEVHLTDPYTREKFRHVSLISDVAELTIKGHGLESYTKAVKHILKSR